MYRTCASLGMSVVNTFDIGIPLDICGVGREDRVGKEDLYILSEKEYISVHNIKSVIVTCRLASCFTQSRTWNINKKIRWIKVVKLGNKIVELIFDKS